MKCDEEQKMERTSLEILLVEDSPADVELAVRALKKHNLANQLQIARDGAISPTMAVDAGRRQIAGDGRSHSR